MSQEGLNNGENSLGYDPDDTYCPQCGREINRKLFSLKAYCTVCDSPIGGVKVRVKDWLGLPTGPTDTDKEITE